MSMALPHYRLTKLTLSDSSLNRRFHTCPRKLELNKFYGHARAEHEDSLAADAGTAIHRAWQHYASTGDKDAAVWELTRSYPWALMPSVNDGRSFYACLSTFYAMLESPLQSRYQLARINVRGEERPAVEVPFRITYSGISALPDRHVPIYYDGYIDAIVWDTLEQRYVVVDIKSTRKRRNDYTTMYSRDPQCLPYAFALEAILGHAIDTLNLIYFVAYVDVTEPRALQYPFIKTQDEIQEWAFSFKEDIERIQKYAALRHFPRNGKECDTWSPCIYNNVCDYTQPDIITQMLDSRFGEFVDDDKHDPWFLVDLNIAA